MKKDIIEDLLRADKNSTRSDRVFIALGMGLAVICGSVLLGYIITAIISHRAAGWYWALSLAPMLILVGFSLLFAIRQLLRNKALTAILTILANAAIVIAIALIVIFTSIYRDEIFLPFFYTL